MDFSRQVNYKSDFDVLLHVEDSEGNTVGFPDFDFLLTFRTNGNKKYEGGQVDGVKRGVTDADGDIRIVFDNHGLLPGVLSLEVRADVADATYPDGKKLTVFDVPTNITLVDAAGEVSTGLKVNVKLPFAYTPASTDDTDGNQGGSEG